MTRSTDSCLNGRVEVDLIGDIGGITGCVRTLFCWQIEHPATKLLTYMESPGHKSPVQQLL